MHPCLCREMSAEGEHATQVRPVQSGHSGRAPSRAGDGAPDNPQRRACGGSALSPREPSPPTGARWGREHGPGGCGELPALVSGQSTVSARWRRIVAPRPLAVGAVCGPGIRCDPCSTWAAGIHHYRSNRLRPLVPPPPVLSLVPRPATVCRRPCPAPPSPVTSCLAPPRRSPPRPRRSPPRPRRCRLTQRAACSGATPDAWAALSPVATELTPVRGHVSPAVRRAPRLMSRLRGRSPQQAVV